MKILILLLSILHGVNEWPGFKAPCVVLRRCGEAGIILNSTLMLNWGLMQSSGGFGHRPYCTDWFLQYPTSGSSPVPRVRTQPPAACPQMKNALVRPPESFSTGICTVSWQIKLSFEYNAR